MICSSHTTRYHAVQRILCLAHAVELSWGVDLLDSSVKLLYDTGMVSIYVDIRIPTAVAQ